MKGYITKEQLSDSLKNKLSDFSSQLEHIENIGDISILSTSISNKNIIGGMLDLTKPITIGDNVTIKNVTFNLQNNLNLALSIIGDNVLIENCKLLNAYGTSNAKFIEILKTATNVNIKGNYFYNIGSGSTSAYEGVTRAIQCQQANNIKISDNYFDGIKGTVESDYIHIQADKMINDYYDRGKILIYNNIFKNTMKSCVKVQCSGVNIENNKIIADENIDTSVFFRVYNSIDTSITNNKSDRLTCVRTAIQTDSNLNCSILNNDFYVNRLNGGTHSIFFNMDNKSSNLKVANNIISSISTINVICQFTGSISCKYNNNTLGNHNIEIVGGVNYTINNNIFNEECSSPIDLTTTSVNGLSIINNTVKKSTRFLQIRIDGNTNIHFKGNKVLEVSNALNPIVLHNTSQSIDEIYVDNNNNMFMLGYGNNNQKPPYKKEDGFVFYNQTTKKVIWWDAINSVWVDYTGATVS